LLLTGGHFELGLVPKKILAPSKTPRLGQEGKSKQKTQQGTHSLHLKVHLKETHFFEVLGFVETIKNFKNATLSHPLFWL